MKFICISNLITLRINDIKKIIQGNEVFRSHKKVILHNRFKCWSFITLNSYSLKFCGRHIKVGLFIFAMIKNQDVIFIMEIFI